MQTSALPVQRAALQKFEHTPTHKHRGEGGQVFIKMKSYLLKWKVIYKMKSYLLKWKVIY